MVWLQTSGGSGKADSAARTFLASSKGRCSSFSMSCAIKVATPTALLPAPKNSTRASRSGVPCAFIPLMNLRTHARRRVLDARKNQAAHQSGVAVNPAVAHMLTMQ